MMSHRVEVRLRVWTNELINFHLPSVSSELIQPAPCPMVSWEIPATVLVVCHLFLAVCLPLQPVHLRIGKRMSLVRDWRLIYRTLTTRALRLFQR